ncbi:ATP-binding protein [Streptomyces sp. NPDC048172]|uniref:ATP-binding protein n=1 Tax=Streptomyces sp. NPDC048172 TaxID=3365505 RepID=UPI00371BB9DD
MGRELRELIGRQHPAGELSAETHRAVRSHGGLVLVTGEAGIGKTSLVAQAADEARQLGALVLGGSCWDSHTAPGYWPWTQVMRGLRRAATPEEWEAAGAAARAAGEGCLPVLLGETGAVSRATGGVSGGVSGGASSGASGGVSGGGEDMFRFQDAVTAVLVAVAQSRPLVVVLDDLHWADGDSLRLLEFAAQHTWFERLLLIGTYRDVEVETPGHPLRPLMMPLLAKATTLTLTGLGREETGLLMARTTGVEPDADLVTEVQERTGGNPFFVEQTARLWHSGGSVGAVAPGVRDALQRRLSLLPEAVTGLLTAAAVLGRRFHRRRLAAVAAQPVPRVDRLLDQAVAARLVTVEGGGTFAFAHDLVRETLYDGLDPAEARALHATAVHAAVHPAVRADGGGGVTARDPHLLPADLARHGYLAGDALDPRHVVKLLTDAANDAYDRLATEEAVGHRRRALERVPEEDPRTRVVIGLTLGAELHRGGEPDEAWEVLARATALARELDDSALLGRAALTAYRTGDIWSRAAWTEDLLREAHARLLPEDGEADGPRRGRTAFLDQLVEELSVRLAALVRENGDDEALSFGLWVRHDVIWGPGTAAERAALTSEMMGAARRSGDSPMEALASSLRWVALLEQGDPRYLEQYHAMLKATERTTLPRGRMLACADRGILAAHRGRFAEAQENYDRAFTEDMLCHTESAYLGRHLRWSLLLLQGRFDELARLHETIGEHGHPDPRLLEALTAIQSLCAGGDAAYGEGGGATARDSAPALRTALAYVGETLTGGEEFPRGTKAMWLRLFAQTAALSGDPALVARARADLAPYLGEWAVAAYGCDIGGPFVLWSALLDAAHGDHDAAVDGLTAALRTADQLGLHTWSLEARSYLGGALLARDAPGDARQAEDLLALAEREATDLGMRHIVRRVQDTRTRAAVRQHPTSLTAAPEETPTDGPAAPAPEGTAFVPAQAQAPTPAPAPAPEGEFQREGSVWKLGFAGRVIHMPDAKGLRDLHLLLSSPGTDLPAARLLSPEGEEEVVAAHTMGGDAVLDDEAKQRYARHLATLDEEIDRAVTRGDDARAAEFDRERDALLAELRAATGLAGRTRRLGDGAERARKTVTARIRDTLRKLDTRHPELAAHLRGAVSTGMVCRYMPERPVTWRL